MYVKYVPGSTNSEEMFRHLFNDIEGLVMGTITDPSQFNSTACNTGASVIAGSGPSAGVYATNAKSSGSNRTYHDYYLRFEKKHYANDGSSFGGKRLIQITRDRDWRMRLTAFTPTLGAAFPTTNTSSTWTGYTNQSYKYQQIFYNWSEILSIHMIINDYTFGMFIRHNAGDNSVNAWWMLQDQEYIASVDNYGYAGNGDYSPQVGILGYNRYMWHPTIVAETDTNNHQYKIGKTQYMRKDGAYSNSGIQHDGNFHYGYMATSEGTHQRTFPTFRDEVFSVPGANGETNHLMVPVSLAPHSNSSVGDVRHGKMMHFYRTTDDLLSSVDDQGVVFYDGTTRYRAFKLHYTGDDNRCDGAADKFGCYLFPEDNPA